jgi:succinate dehydrogenase / fumarate reductase cytochrome b subunit
VTAHNQGSASQTGRYHFLLRRLHSLSGIIPVGVFLMFHLTVNATTIFGGEMFQKSVDMIHGLGPLVVPVEILFIFIPIAFHAILGIQIWLTSRSNTAAYPYADNWRYTLQRYTGIVALVFILFHLWHMHWTGAWLGGGWFDPHDATNTAALAMQRSALFTVIYIIGMLCAVYHFANGIWTFVITWGFADPEGGQRRMGYVAGLVGVVLALAGMTSLFALNTANVSQVTADGQEQAIEHTSDAGHGASGHQHETH